MRTRAVPAEDSAEPSPEPEEEPHGAICGHEVLHRQKGPKVDDGTARSAPGKLDRPDVAPGDVREQRMRSEVDSLVFFSSRAHRIDRLAPPEQRVAAPNPPQLSYQRLPKVDWNPLSPGQLERVVGRRTLLWPALEAGGQS